MTETSPVASRDGLPGRAARRRRGDAVRLRRDGGPAAAARRDPRARTATTTSRGTARRWASSRCAGRGSRRATTTRRSRRSGGRTTAGSRPATSCSIHPRGFIQIKDRSKDVIKSGGEWISSVELENALMAHPAVAEAAVIAIPDAKWDERPLAAVVLQGGADRDRRRAARVPRAEVREVVAARADRVRRRDPEDERRQVPQDRSCASSSRRRRRSAASA